MKTFSLQEYEAPFRAFTRIVVNQLMAELDPVFGKITSTQSGPIPISQNTLQSGKVLESPRIMAEAMFELKSQDILNCNVDAFAAGLFEIAKGHLDQMMPGFFSHVAAICEASGNTIDARGKPITHELILQMIDKLEIDFDAGGNPVMLTMVVPPEIGAKIQALPPLSAAQLQAWDDMIERKRRDFNARRRNRILS